MEEERLSAYDVMMVGEEGGPGGVSTEVVIWHRFKLEVLPDAKHPGIWLLCRI